MDIAPEAREKLAQFLQDYDDGFVRVARLATGGACCARLTLGVTVDEEKDEDNDLSFSVDGLPVVIEKGLYESLKDIRIGFEPDSGITVSAGSS